MAVLSDTDRAKIWRGLMRYVSAARDPIAVEKADLLAAVNAIDDFLNANATAINNAFPAAAKANLTTGQKAVIVAMVALARYNPAVLVNILGSVD